MTKRRHLFAALYLLALTALCLVIAMEETEAATYNFYFNNTEQGANSTAAPTVTVQDGKLVKKPGDTSTATEVSTETGTGNGNGLPVSIDETPAEGETIEEKPEPVGTSAASAQEIGAMERTFPDAKWKVTVGASSMSYKSQLAYRYGSDTLSDARSKLSASLSYYILPVLGLSARLGRMTGLEIELNPFRTRTGWGKLQLGGTLGVFRDNVDDELYVSVQENNFYRVNTSLNIFVGAHVGLNIVRDLTLGYSYRIAPIEAGGIKLAMNELNLSYLF